MDQQNKPGCRGSCGRLCTHTLWFLCCLSTGETPWTPPFLVGCNSQSLTSVSWLTAVLLNSQQPLLGAAQRCLGEAAQLLDTLLCNPAVQVGFAMGAPSTAEDWASWARHGASRIFPRHTCLPHGGHSSRTLCLTQIYYFKLFFAVLSLLFCVTVQLIKNSSFPQKQMLL